MAIWLTHANFGICRWGESFVSAEEDRGSRLWTRVTTAGGRLPWLQVKCSLHNQKCFFLFSEPPCQVSAKENLRWLFLWNLLFKKQIWEENRSTKLKDILEVKLLIKLKWLITSLMISYPACNGTFPLMRVDVFREPIPLSVISSYHRALPLFVPKSLMLVLEQG